MESWVPLFEIFMNSRTPETEASLWLQTSFNAASSSKTAPPVTTGSFLSLLTKPCDAIVKDPSVSSPSTTTRIMFIQTLPDMVQSRILSFLAFEHQRFCVRELSKLARNILSGNQELDFWVKRAARNLLDAVSGSNLEWISGLSLGSDQETAGKELEEFESLPDWLKDAASDDNRLLSWLPLPPGELGSRFSADACEFDENFLSQAGENRNEGLKEATGDNIEIYRPADAPLEPEIQELAGTLRARIMNFESRPKAVALANEIRELCLNKGADSIQVLNVIEPWKASDETASVLISHLSSGYEEELAWPSQVLCSNVLPKFLALEEPASRLLVTSTIEYCKLHQRAAVYALLFPLVLRREGINNPICDVITKIIRECLHPAHVSAFCQKLLCGGEEDRRFILLPCHHGLISNELVWTESLFNLFQNILTHNIYLTQDSVDHLVSRLRELAERFCRSLKFGNFLLCLVTKCVQQVKSHKCVLTESAKCTDTLVTKSVLSKLGSF